MTDTTRRSVLLGFTLGAGLSVSAFHPSRFFDHGNVSAWTLEKLGHSLLGTPPVEFAEGSVRSDGGYAALGTWNGKEYGSFLVDLADPANPTKAHFLSSPDRVMNLDVKFGPREGLYYRSQQPIENQAMAGVEIIDYGFADGSPEDPTVVGRLEAGSTHNIFPHFAEPLLYAVNHDQNEETQGLEIWDVSDPTTPERRNVVGRPWSLHDVTLDTDLELLHCAYGRGYVVMDASDPVNPKELGRFDYEDKPSYEEVGLGNEGFETGHLAKKDPRRDLVVMGDEVSMGVPGGKHIFDIGWGDGSPENPIPIGFTTSPNAKIQEIRGKQSKGDVIFDWTGHNFDIVPWGESTLLVSGDWHEGVVLYDITDPRDPTPIDRYQTADRADEKPGQSRWGPPPMAWSAVYNPQRDLVVVSDVVTGIYTFRIAGPPKPTAIQTDTGANGTGNSTPFEQNDSPPTESTNVGRGNDDDESNAEASKHSPDQNNRAWYDFNNDGRFTLEDITALGLRLFGG